MRLSIVPAFLVLAAASYGTASAADRQGHFGRAPGDMSMCVGMAVHAAHPDLEFDMNVSQPQSVGAKKYRSDLDNIWVAEFHESGADATDVVLRNVTASPADLDEVWRIVEQCAEG